MLCTLFIGIKICGKKIGKEKELQDCKHNKKFDQDNLPESATCGHGTKAVNIERNDFSGIDCHVKPPEWKESIRLNLLAWQHKHLMKLYGNINSFMTKAVLIYREDIFPSRKLFTFLVLIQGVTGHYKWAAVKYCCLFDRREKSSNT